MKTRIIIALIYLILGVLLIFIPTVLAPVCDMCRMQTLPALIVVGVLIIVLSIVNVFYSIRRKD
jgi:hypothetical protein